MKDYKITEEEINQTILHSPYSLADSPTSVGLKAKQIKRYFYEFIRFFANKINIHLNDLGKTLEGYDEVLEAVALIPDLEEKDVLLGNQIDLSILAHNQSSESHPYLKEKIENEVARHNSSALSHGDIRSTLKSILNKLDVAYCLASGKSQVYSCEDILDVLDEINKKGIYKGDLFLVADPSMPDFTVFETDISSVPSGTIELDYSSVASGEMELEAGKSYYYNGVRMIASVGTLETNLLAKNEDLETLEGAFLAYKEIQEAWQKSIENELECKEASVEKVEASSQELELASHKEYNLGLITTLSLSLPKESAGLEAIVNFRTGATAPTFDSPSELVFSGDDAYEGRFYPITNRLYEINIKDVMGILIARVGATDYEVIE